ncbi:hypothetical protein [Rummeliibacillus sp. TYF-LIM-RU47]|uniref:hypothetical protein n=1 Tax=Rummeliibacillus sp. TYF-LIM-RU47 TaxID=2608406 RepID=UPI0012392E83|nr:hypothetical protein [Rummeliibacillus sp. TYF-LIM-RU47]
MVKLDNFFNVEKGDVSVESIFQANPDPLIIPDLRQTQLVSLDTIITTRQRIITYSRDYEEAILLKIKFFCLYYQEEHNLE